MDPAQQQAQQNLTALAGLGAGFFIFVAIFAIVALVYIVYCLWRIFSKAGLSGALSLLMFIPGIGWLIVLSLLAFMDWKVVPVNNQYSGLPPGGGYPPTPYPSPYQPQPAYTPPTAYPPSTPPTQL